MDSGQSWSRKNGRLESFLQRQLADEWARVSWYEPAIVDSAGEKPAFRYLVLTDEHLYVTDNPPRQIVTSVQLGDVAKVELVNDYPAFLKGVERENAQHIKVCVTGRTRARERRRQRPVSPSSESLRTASTSRPLSRQTILSEPAVSRTPRLSAEAVSIYSDPGVNDSYSENETKQQRWRRLLAALLRSRRNEGGRPPLAELHPVGEDSLSPPDSQTGEPSSPLPRSLAPYDDGNATRRNSLQRPYLSRLWPFGKNKMAKVDQPESLLASPSSSSEGQSRLGFLTPDGQMTWEKNSSNQTKGSNNEDLHLYILTPQSTFFRLLKSTWSSYLIRSTLRQDNRYQPTARNGIREHYEQTLLDLYRHLQIRTDDSWVHLRRQVDATEKELAQSSLAKRLFWKDPNLFPAVVNKLHSLVAAPDINANISIGTTMDKLKLATSIVTTLSELLRETESYPGRTRHLTSKGAQKSRELLAILTASPWIPLPYYDITIKVATSYDSFSCLEWETLQEAPLIRSLAELTNACTAALYYFIQLAYQGRELTTNQKSYSVMWLVKTLSELSSLEVFIARLMCQMLLLTVPARSPSLSPKEAVLLLQQVSVLLSLVTYSPTVAVHVKLSYSEEFRYYILSHVVGSKLLVDYPIRSNLLQLVDNLRKVILDKKLTLLTSSQYATVHNTG